MARRNERVGRDAEEWAYAEHGEELFEAARRLMRTLRGPSDPAWVAQHWAMLDHELLGGATAARRYAELPRLDETDRDIAGRIADSRVGVFRVAAVRLGERIDLVDVLGGEHVSVASANVSRAAVGGGVLVGRVVAGAPCSLWGPARVFGPRDGAVLIDEVMRPTERDRVDVLRQTWPSLLAFDTSLPRVVAWVAWDLDEADAVLDALPDAFEYERVADDGADVLVWRIGPGPGDFGGYLELNADGMVLWTFAESLVDEARELIGRSLGPLVRPAERRAVPLGGLRQRRWHQRRAA